MKTRLKGFTLVELMIAVTILAVLLVMGIPSFQTFMINRAIRSTTDSLYNGLQVARANAIRTNNPTVFRLLGSQNNFTGWEVFEVMPAGSVTAGRDCNPSGSMCVVEVWTSTFTNTTTTADPAGPTGVTFDSLGRARAKNDTSLDGVTAPKAALPEAPLVNINITLLSTPTQTLAVLNGKGIFPLRVEVTAAAAAGGAVRTCAPHLPSTDAKACR